MSLKEIEFSEIKMKKLQFMNTWKIHNQTKIYRINADWFSDMELEYQKKNYCKMSWIIQILLIFFFSAGKITIFYGWPFNVCEWIEENCMTTVNVFEWGEINIDWGEKWIPHTFNWLENATIPPTLNQLQWKLTKLLNDQKTNPKSNFISFN